MHLFATRPAQCCMSKWVGGWAGGWWGVRGGGPHALTGQPQVHANHGSHPVLEQLLDNLAADTTRRSLHHRVGANCAAADHRTTAAAEGRRPRRRRWWLVLVNAGQSQRRPHRDGARLGHPELHAQLCLFAARLSLCRRRSVW